MKFSRKMCLGNIKSYKKALDPLYRKYNFKETTGGAQIDPPTYLELRLRRICDMDSKFQIRISK